MTPSENKAVVRHFMEELHSKRNLDSIDAFVAADVVSHDPFPGQKPGALGFRETMEYFNAAFPDKRISIRDMLAEGDKVMVKATVQGTHLGEFMGQPPTDKPIEYEEVLIFRLLDGKIVEHWAIADALALMQQIGAIPG